MTAAKVIRATDCLARRLHTDQFQDRLTKVDSGWTEAANREGPVRADGQGTARVRIEEPFLTLAIWDQRPILPCACHSVAPVIQYRHEPAPRRGSECDVYTPSFQVLE